MNIIRDKERVNQTGEIFTPTPLVNEILNKLSPDVFIDHTKTFCDPACGDGQFLVEVLIRKLNNGSSAWQAASAIYGVDLMEDNVKLCKKRISKILSEHAIKHEGARELAGGIKKAIRKNIVCSDAFDWDFERWDKTPEAVKKAERIAKEIEQKELADDILGKEE